MLRPFGTNLARAALARAANALLAIWAAASLVWLALAFIPGDPARVLAGQRADPEVLDTIRNLPQPKISWVTSRSVSPMTVSLTSPIGAVIESRC